MKKNVRNIMMTAGVCVLSSAFTMGALAAEADNSGYDSLVKAQGERKCFSASITTKATVPSLSTTPEKKISLQVNRLKSDSPKGIIKIETSEGTTSSYYHDGYFYTTENDKKVRTKMDKDEFMEVINSYLYLDMTSDYLSMVTSKEKEGATVYSFASDADTIGDYADTLLLGSDEDSKVEIELLNGSITTEDDSNLVSERDIKMVYSVGKKKDAKTTMLNTKILFHNPESLKLKMPDLSSYSDEGKEEEIQVTAQSQTIYATHDVNIRAKNTVNSAILGGLSAGGAIKETGYTNDGWVQVDYNGGVGYIAGDYVSTTKPVIVTAMSGMMYAVYDVNVRDTYSTNGGILGMLSKGNGVSTTGYTDNGWIRVSYNGAAGYVSANYLTWDAPKAAPTATGDTMTLTDSSGTTVTINYYSDGNWYDKDGNIYYAEGAGEWDRGDGKTYKAGSGSSDSSSSAPSGNAMTIFDAEGHATDIYQNPSTGLWSDEFGDYYEAQGAGVWLRGDGAHYRTE